MKDTRSLLCLVLVTLFAWLLREYFVQVTVVESPIRGDVRDYVAYAWNLLNHGVFSRAWPSLEIPPPDNYRGPGYPLFVAGLMAIEPRPNAWYGLVLHGQAALGALTATFTVLLGRHWLPERWALAAGVLVALWPHHIAATGAVLTEVLFGFLLVVALLLFAESLRRRSLAWAVASGIAFSAATLTNMVALLFPLFIAVHCWRECAPRLAIALLFFALLGPGSWGARNAMLPEQGSGEPGRIAMNLVQGSWPQYHTAFTYRNKDPIARDIMRGIDHEIELLDSDLAAGYSKVKGRISRDPAYYLQWYLLDKPFLLWDWDIRIGIGDVYFHRLSHSPLETQAVLRATKQALEWLNPAIFALSALASFTLLAGWIRRRPWVAPAAAMVAAFTIYVTAVHTILQAEPRYSIPYRPMQLLMLATALSWLYRQMRVRQK